MKEQEKDKTISPLAKGTSYFLIYLTGIYPLNSAVAGGITPDNTQTQIHNNGNVPVVNIAAPNNAGISHNTYHEFNTGTQGAVLNNATQAINSQLAGQISANANLQGKAAELIINEVTGSNRSELLGQLEVAGQKANVMIANPNGITCDGCGFINTTGAILTTGKPQFDSQGALDALAVTKGQITIGGKGLNGQSTDYVDIISRATELNGKIQANNLAITQGANQISFKDGTSKTIAGEGAVPQLAVDTKALGGMYANKIRLIATESGVGVNLKDITSTQGDITLSANGKMELGNIKAKTDLNAGAKEINIGPSSSVQAKQDIILAGDKISNKGSVTAGQDMRVYGESISNTGPQALLQSNNNMWIQKNASGDKSQYIENKSATIKTDKGDLIIRAEKLANIQNFSLRNDLEIEATSTRKNNKTLTYEFKYLKWFDVMDFYKNNALNVKRSLTQYNVNSPKSSIESSNNLFINSTELENINSDIKSKKDLILTGRNLNIISTQNGEKDIFHTFGFGFPCIWGCDFDYSFIDLGETHSWKDVNPTMNSLLFSEGNLIIDFSNNINLEKKRAYDIEKTGEITIDSDNSDALVSLKDIVLSSSSINNNTNIKSDNDISIIANDYVNTHQSKISAKNGLSIIAPNNIEIIQSDLKAKDITLISKEGDIKASTDNTRNYFLPNNIRWLSEISAVRDLSISAGKSIFLSNLRFKPQNGDITVTANQGIVINYDDSILKNNKKLSQPFDKENDLRLFNEALSIEKLNTIGSVSLNAGNKPLKLKGIGIKAGKDISLISAKEIDLGPRIIGEDFNYRYRRDKYDDSLWMYNNPMFKLLPGVGDNDPNNNKKNSGEIQSAQDHFQFWVSPSTINNITSKIQSGGDLLINAGKNLSAQSVILSSEGHTLLSAGKNISFNSFPYFTVPTPLIGYDLEQKRYHLTSDIKGGRKLTLTANGTLTTQGATLYSGGDLNLISGGNMYFEPAQNNTIKLNGRSSDYNSNTVNHTGTKLNSDGDLNILTHGGILFQATKLVAKNVMNIAAKGGYLYAQALEDVTDYKTSSSKRNWHGRKKTSTTNHHSVINKVTEFVADGDINLLSHDDSTYEASKIETNNNATLTSTHGKVNFKAVKDSAFEQTISQSKGFFIQNGNSGYSAETWILPSVHIGGKLTIDAANGISADIKTQKGQTLQAALAALGDTPETAWLKGLNQRQDVHWNEVQDAYESWNYQDQHLNPAVSAAIAIAVAVVTAGAGVTVAAAGYTAGAATTVGASAATAAAVGGAVTAGMASLASTAAVKLINNGGNISKTLKEMGNSETVKSTATSMAIGGALAGFDNLIGVEKTANGATKAPLLSNKADWSKVAQRVAGQSVISSSLNTAINGGSFKDNFAAALLTNVGNQINAEGANIIGNNGAVLGAPGKAISHAAVSALAAEIGGGDAKGAAAGALAAELATVVMESSLFESKYRNEPERQFHKIQEAIQGNEAKAQTVQVIGALSGALISGTPEGVYSAANSADLVYRYNYTEHQWDQIFQENGRDIAAAASGDKAAAARVAARQDGAIAALAVAGGAYVTVAGGYILAAATEEMLFAGRMAFEACKVQGSFCINKMGIFVADAMAPEAALGTGALGVGTVKILGYSSESAKNLANELNHASTALLSKNQKPNTYAVTGLIEQEAKRALENYRVYDLNKVTDKALDLNLVRQETLKYLKASHQKNDKAVSYATASVDTNGITEYYLSVSGKAWSGSSPTTVNIGGVNYKVILTDSESIPSIGIIKTQKTNLNHAEQKLFSYIQDNYNGQKANVNISVQNTSIMEPGMCIGCGYTSQNFAEMNKNFNVNIFQGSTGANP
ncbi:DUF637 domain-containing protein [Xenorhabdus sp. PB61.4]|uniref:DUF637 domain-containing protein n=1 Tax=Xenorhabdus sp. PB61.4 TaxID=2788940 RepID=UPI001E2D7CF6|nr:DUF637 domain-containing protein [Xenorhabdus sp. PB61.4]MCC8368193.1 DUF637 domain-containing protein [Xenorhabdus sp. PB61.4]